MNMIDGGNKLLDIRRTVKVHLYAVNYDGNIPGMYDGNSLIKKQCLDTEMVVKFSPLMSLPSLCT